MQRFINRSEQDIMRAHEIRGKRLKVVPLFFAAALGTAAATVAWGKAPVSLSDTPATNASSETIVSDPAYQLGSGDEVRITVYGDDSLTGEFAVSATGVISFPLIGDVQAGGHTLADVQATITSKLADGYIRDPRVSAEVLTYRPFYILGEVMRPGQFPYTNGLTVLNAVATAQGFTYRANTHYVFIKHAHEQTEEKEPLSSATPVAPGDTIRIIERYF